jgi:hypothetical protein
VEFPQDPVVGQTHYPIFGLPVIVK